MLSMMFFGFASFAGILIYVDICGIKRFGLLEFAFFHNQNIISINRRLSYNKINMKRHVNLAAKMPVVAECNMAGSSCFFIFQNIACYLGFVVCADAKFCNILIEPVF